MNQSNLIDRKSLLLSLVFIFILVIIAGSMGVYVASDSAIEQAIAITGVAIKIDEMYADDVNWQKMIDAGRQAMFSKLDRYCSYFQKSQFENLDEELKGSYSGIGVSIIHHDDGLLIMSVREDGPSAEVGLLSGDIIIEADSISLTGLKIEEATSLLRGKEGTKVLIKVWRPATDEIFRVEITRRRIPFLHIPFAGYTPDNIIYIRMLDFDPGASKDLRNALDSLLANKNKQPEGIILDLRGNPGGLFSEGYETADLFLDEGIFMVGTEGRSRWNNKKFYSTGNDVTGELPMVIIVDRGAASSAEIVAGSLQQTGRAVLVGDTTFGKGLVQGFVRFPDGDGLKLTISRYYFEGPTYLNDFDSTLNDTGHGLIPDYYFKTGHMNLFQRKLENSLVLRQFAALLQDDIIDAVKADSLDDRWIKRLKTYTLKDGFTYKSYSTALAEYLKALSVLERNAKDIEKLADKIIHLSIKEDMNQFFDNKGYIKLRLAQIAYQREFGTYRAYKEVLVKSRPEILFAAKILKEKNDD